MPAPTIGDALSQLSSRPEAISILAGGEAITVHRGAHCEPNLRINGRAGVNHETEKGEDHGGCPHIKF